MYNPPKSKCLRTTSWPVRYFRAFSLLLNPQEKLVSIMVIVSRTRQLVRDILRDDKFSQLTVLVFEVPLCHASSTTISFTGPYESTEIKLKTHSATTYHHLTSNNNPLHWRLATGYKKAQGVDDKNDELSTVHVDDNGWEMDWGKEGRRRRDAFPLPAISSLLWNIGSPRDYMRPNSYLAGYSPKYGAGDHDYDFHRKGLMSGWHVCKLEQLSFIGITRHEDTGGRELTRELKAVCSPYLHRILILGGVEVNGPHGTDLDPEHAQLDSVT
ncbi:hypothetical protein B0H19DRAFT_1055172 [Mycena capillaripes]|nr:hypothetical protein B0H19DRAFT_1055172 [Mycena capillaripes]